MLSLMLFTDSVELATQAAEAGIDRIVVDIETRGKEERQTGYHLECSRHRIEDLILLRDLPVTRVLRTNSLWEGTPEEIAAGVAAGADWLMLPMVRNAAEVERFVRLVDGRAGVIALVETLSGLTSLREIGQIAGVGEVYVGLNDLRLDAGWGFGYQALVEGLLDRFLLGLPRPYGFGGITVVDGGRPLPTRDILCEMARLGASRVIIRRAFKRDIVGRDMAREVKAIQRTYSQYRKYSVAALEVERKRIWQKIRTLIKEARAAMGNPT